MRVAVIPARGGSKRIPRKNIRAFCGKPMIGWSIEAAQASGCFDRILVSTEDAEIAEVARSFGADVPFVRPSELADDFAATVPVIAHATKWCADHMAPPDAVCCIYATAPFLRAQDVQEGLRLLEATNADYVLASTTYAFPIQRAVRRLSDGRIQMFDPAQDQVRSQDLEEAYHDAGQFYWGRAQAWLDQTPILGGPNSAAIVLPRARVQDIDTPEDWERAEAMFRVLNG